MHTFDSPKIDLAGKSILVTGGTGSFGKAFIERVLDRHDVRRVVVYSRDEMKQWEMSNEPAFRNRKNLRFFIGDVRDMSRLEGALRGIDIVVHAAALKHVPAAEYNPMECIHTNVYGAENVVQASIRAGVKKVVALSTDKAANPVNLYGASKLASDKIFVAANNMSGAEGCRFSVVRYGNVVGSRGSVVPFFRKLVAEGTDHLPITDPRMTRFWITLDQGVSFVLSSMAMMTGGEIFVPKIPSMKVTDIARCIAPELPHKVVGIRPGEKLHEVMISAEDSFNTIELDDRYVVEPPFAFWTEEKPTIQGGKPVQEGFCYSSDNNPVWLDGDAMNEILERYGK